MGLLDMLLGGVGGNQMPASIGFRSNAYLTRGDALYDEVAEVLALITAVAHAGFVKIWEMTVPAQQRMSWGFGSPGLPHNQGYMWFAALNINVDWDVGILRLVQAKANDVGQRYVVAEIPDSALHTTTVTTLATARPTDRNTMIALPEKVEFPLIGEDSKLQLHYALLDTATTHDAVGFDIPITVYQ